MANAQIKITPATLRAQSAQLRALQTRMADLSAKSTKVINLLDEALTGSFNILMRTKGNIMLAQMKLLCNDLDTAAQIANRCAETYENADKVIRDTIGDSLPDEVVNTPVSTQEVVPDVVVNENYNIPNSPSLEITPHKTNAPGSRSPEAYKEVLADLDVENRKRYQPRNGSTWCNIYVWDATKAMGCEIPHYYDPKTGQGLSRDYCLKNPGSYLEMSANRMTTWLTKYGAQNGWIECDQATAIAMANKGMPTVVAATTTGHVGMVVPQNEGDTGVMISQAGASNFDYGAQRNGFGNYPVKYFYHV